MKRCAISEGDMTEAETSLSKMKTEAN